MDIYMTMSYKLGMDWQMHFNLYDETNFSSNSYALHKLNEGKQNYLIKILKCAQYQQSFKAYATDCISLIHYWNLTTYLTLVLSTSLSGIDKLKKMDLFVVTDDTWQGIIGKTWPYSKFSLALSGKFQINVLNVHYAYIEENDWKFLEGQGDFDECMDDYQSQNCVSIFDPRPTKNR